LTIAVLSPTQSEDTKGTSLTLRIWLIEAFGIGGRHHSSSTVTDFSNNALKSVTEPVGVGTRKAIQTPFQLKLTPQLLPHR